MYTLERLRDKHADAEKRTYKLIGIYLDEYLNFDYNTTTLCKKIVEITILYKHSKKICKQKSPKTPLPCPYTFTS